MLVDPWVGKIPWRRERLPMPAFWPGEFDGLYSPWGRKELDTTERLSLTHSEQGCVLVSSLSKGKTLPRKLRRVSVRVCLFHPESYPFLHSTFSFPTCYLLCSSSVFLYAFMRGVKRLTEVY